MHQQAATVNMPQEIVPQTRSFAGTLNNAGNIRHDEADAVIHIHHAQIGIQSGEMIVGNLGMSLAHHTKERGFSYIGEAHQPHIRQQLQLQDHIMALTGQTRLGKTGYLPGGGGKMLVAPAAAAALAEHKRFIIRHILDNFAGLRIPDQRAPGHTDYKALTVLAALAAPLAVYTVACHILALIAEVHEGGHVIIHPHDDAAAVAAVTAVWATGGYIFFPVKGYGTVAAVAGPDGDSSLINKAVCHTKYLAA